MIEESTNYYFRLHLELIQFLGQLVVKRTFWGENPSLLVMIPIFVN